jgi:hypothetical protein
MVIGRCKPFDPKDRNGGGRRLDVVPLFEQFNIELGRFSASRTELLRTFGRVARLTSHPGLE